MRPSAVGSASRGRARASGRDPSRTHLLPPALGGGAEAPRGPPVLDPFLGRWAVLSPTPRLDVARCTRIFGARLLALADPCALGAQDRDEDPPPILGRGLLPRPSPTSRRSRRRA